MDVPTVLEAESFELRYCDLLPDTLSQSQNVKQFGTDGRGDDDKASAGEFR